ncbi:MAG: hypothetical protein A2007_01135 [Verrucomicrobia bacterium GWC2_42_7]|nr:MAG: hypothetical protein A2007_01135 [Verrucomicrobia bacterium GWC2_42_7]
MNIFENPMPLCMSEMWQHLLDVKGYEMYDKEGILALKSNVNVPWLNYSWVSSVTAHNLDLLTGFFGKQQFFLTVDEEQNKQSDLLLGKDFEYSCEVPEMLLTLTDFPWDNKSQISAEIEQVRNEKDLNDWIKVAAEGSDEEEWSVGQWVKGLFDAKKERIKLFLGRVEKEPAVTSMIFQGNKLSVLFYISTLPKFRKKGLGHAVLSATFKDSLAHGVEQCLIYATEMAPGFYQKENFKLTSTLHEYWHL